MLSLLLLAASHASATCASPRTEDDLSAALGRAELAWDEPPPRFQSAAAEVHALLPCLYAPVTVPTAARLHAFQRLAALAAGDEERACAEFAAARRLIPRIETPAWLLTAGKSDNSCARGGEPRGEIHQRPPIRGAALYFDGRRSSFRPNGATFFQVSSLDGTSAAHMLGPDDDVPDYPPRSPVLRVCLGVGAGVAAAGALAAMIGDLALQETWRDYPFADDPDRNVDLVNGLGVTTIVLGTTAAGLGLGAVVEATW